MITELKINNKIFAKYTVENKVIYLSESKINKLKKNDDLENKTELLHLIQLIEQTKFISVGGLNLNDF